MSHAAFSFCSTLLKLSSKLRSIRAGKQLHAHVIKSGMYNTSHSLQIQILNLYVKCEHLNHAHHVFDEMRFRNIVAWNALITGLVNNHVSNSLSYLKRMLSENVGPDDITFNALFRGCCVGPTPKEDVLYIGRVLHCVVMKIGFDLGCFVGSEIVGMYARCGLVEDARCAFDCVLRKDQVLWNVMVHCYGLNSLAGGAFEVLSLMKVEGFKGDEFTYSSLLCACSSSLVSCVVGMQVHGGVIRRSFDFDVRVCSGLVDMYAKNGNLGDACRVFDAMFNKNVVTWNTLIVGYGNYGLEIEAVKLLREMFRGRYYPDGVTLASIVSSCGNVPSAIELMQVHAYMIKLGFHSFSSVANALITAYSKCGSIASASACFVLVTEPDLVTWTSVIRAYGFHGLAKEATQIFDKMLSHGIRPDKIVFLGVLSACSHGGLVKKGLYYFKLMTDEYQIFPDSEHFTCLIDLLGRAGLLDEAFKILTSMDIKTDPDTFGAFIAACKVNGNVGLAKWAAEKLLTLEPNEPVNYTLMSNIYSIEGQWANVERVRHMLSYNSDQKTRGCSWL